MNTRSKKALAAAGATLAVAAGAGGALAAGGKGAREPGAPPRPGRASPRYLGLTPAQLRQQLGSGKTLAQIAVAQGRTVAGLENAIYADVQTHLDRAVANGRLTKAQEQTLLARLKSRLDDLVNHAFPRVARCPARPARPASRRRGHRLPRHHAGAAPHQLRAGKSTRPDRHRPREDRHRAEGVDPRRGQGEARQGGRHQAADGSPGQPSWTDCRPTSTSCSVVPARLAADDQPSAAATDLAGAAASARRESVGVFWEGAHGETPFPPCRSARPVGARRSPPAGRGSRRRCRRDRRAAGSADRLSSPKTRSKSGVVR